MSTTKRSQLIELTIEYHPDGCWAITSKDLTGLVLAGKDIKALIDDVPTAIKLLYELNEGVQVEVGLLDDDVPAPSQFIPLPSKYVALTAAA